jgi:hypothetical protein
MGVAAWGPWNWDLWNTPLEPDDDASLELYRQKLDEALQAGRKDDKTLADKVPNSNA